MLNPLFYAFLTITIVLSYFSLLNWRLGLLLFFIYIQFFGIIKRVILFIGLDNISYNILIVSQYLFLVCIIIGSIKANKNKKISNGKAFFWLAVFSTILIISTVISPFGLGISIPIAIIQYCPVFILIAGLYLEEKQINDLKSMLIKTAPLHALYQIYQFFFGVFNFELAFAESKSSITNFAEGDFIRGIPLYDSVDPLYIHFAFVFLLLLKSKKTIFSLLNMLLIIIALILIGNRSGLVILFIAIMIWLILEWRVPLKKAVLSIIFVVTVTSLSIFGYLLMDVISNLESLNISQSDFGTRLGNLQTYSDRIVGRQKASENVTFFGKGLGSSGLAATTLANKGFNYDPSANDIYAHDLVGEVILDMGIAGIIIFGYLIWTLVKYFTYKRNDSCYLAIILSSFLASSLLGGSFTYGRAGYFVFLFAGYLLNKIRKSTEIYLPAYA